MTSTTLSPYLGTCRKDFDVFPLFLQSMFSTSLRDSCTPLEKERNREIKKYKVINIINNIMIHENGRKNIKYILGYTNLNFFIR